MADVIYIQNARLSFPHIAQPHSANADGSNPKYSADLLVSAQDPQYAAFMQAVTTEVNSKWGEHGPAILQMISADRRLRGYGQGEEKINKRTMQPYDGYAGMSFISASTDMQPQIVGPDGVPMDPSNNMAIQQEVRRMYGGCYVNAAIKIWLQDNTHGRAVRVDFVAIQFAADGEAFGEAAPDVSGVFGAVQTPVAPGQVPGQPAPMAPASTGAAVPAQAPAGMGMAPPAPVGQPAPVAPAPVAPAPMGMPAPAAAPAPAPAAAQPVQGQDGQWYDPATGQVVAPPAMPGYQPQ